jgi:hypothetical protein
MKKEKLSNSHDNSLPPSTGADPGNSERGGRDCFGKNPYTGMWKKVMILSKKSEFY